jgi:cyclase
MRDKIKAKSNIIDFAKSVQDKGAGEIIIQSIERDGTYNGYDLELTKSIAENVDIPVVALGGASKLEDFKEVCISGKAHAAAAGSLFVYHGPRRGILVNYPELEELNNLFNDK